MVSIYRDRTEGSLVNPDHFNFPMHMMDITLFVTRAVQSKTPMDGNNFLI